MPKKTILAIEGDTFNEGEGRRITISKFPPKTNIQDIKEFFGPDSVEAVTLYAHLAFVQFKRPTDFTEALLKNKNKLRGFPVHIRTYKKDDPGASRKSGQPTKSLTLEEELERREKQRQREKAKNIHRQRRSRTRSRSRSPNRNRSPGGRGSRNGGRRSRSRSRSRSRERSSRTSNDYDRRHYSNYERERDPRYSSPSRNDRYISSNGGGYNSWPTNQPHQQQQPLQHQAVIRQEPMSGVHIMAPNQFSFGLNSVPVSSFSGTMPLPPTKANPPRPALSGPSEPMPNLQRIFSEHVNERPAVEPKLVLPEPIVKVDEIPKIPANVDLLLKLILDSGSVHTLSVSQLQTLISYFTQVRNDIELGLQPTRMPSALSKAGLQVQPQQQALVAFASANHSSQSSTVGEASGEQLVVNGDSTMEGNSKQTTQKDESIESQLLELRNKILAK